MNPSEKDLRNVAGKMRPCAAEETLKGFSVVLKVPSNQSKAVTKNHVVYDCDISWTDPCNPFDEGIDVWHGPFQFPADMEPDPYLILQGICDDAIDWENDEVDDMTAEMRKSAQYSSFCLAQRGFDPYKIANACTMSWKIGKDTVPIKVEN